jgi:DTW domain-containing protein YfiP
LTAVLRDWTDEAVVFTSFYLEKKVGEGRERERESCYGLTMIVLDGIVWAKAKTMGRKRIILASMMLL